VKVTLRESATSGWFETGMKLDSTSRIVVPGSSVWLATVVRNAVQLPMLENTPVINGVACTTEKMPLGGKTWSV